MCSNSVCMVNFFFCSQNLGKRSTQLLSLSSVHYLEYKLVPESSGIGKLAFDFSCKQKRCRKLKEKGVKEM